MTHVFLILQQYSTFESCHITMDLRSFVLFVLATGSCKAMWPDSWIIGETCHNCATQTAFDSCNPQDIKCLCRSDNFLATVALCISNHANKSSMQRDIAWDHFTYSVCEVHDATVSDQDYQKAIKHLDGTSAAAYSSILPSSAPLTRPVEIVEEQYQQGYTATFNYLYQKDVSVWQGSFLVGYWIFIMMIASASRFLQYMSVRFSHQQMSMQRPPKWKRWINRRILMPACFGFKHMCRLSFFGGDYMVPTRFEAIVIAIYFILNIIFTVTPYEFLENDPLFQTQWKEMMRFVSDRSGIICTIQMPLLVLFALRNNFLIWFTGWNYTVFNTYHRAVARVAFIQLIVHAVTKHVFAASYGASLVKYFYPMPYYRWGVAATFLMVLMIISGTYRVNYYEWFLRFHIAAAIGAFVCTIYHLNGLGYKQPIYVAFGLWLGDWLIRLGRLLFLNFSVIMTPTYGSSRSTFAQLCLLGNDVVNVKVRTPVHWKFKPGQYCFIHVSRLRFWEAHPFSMISPGPDRESFQLLCKQRGGMTKRIVSHLKKKGTTKQNPITMRVLVEGPYGIHCPVERYDNVFLIAGGVGITGVLPYVEWLVKQERCPTISFVWTVQTHSDASWVGDKLDHLLSVEKCDIRIYAMKNDDKDSLFDVNEGYLQEKEKEHLTRADASAFGGSRKHQEVIERKSSTSSDATIMTNTTVDRDAVKEQHFDNPHFRNLGLLSDVTLNWQTSSQDPSVVNVGAASKSALVPQPHQHYRETELASAAAASDKKRKVTPGRYHTRIKPGRPPLNPMVESFFKNSDGSVCVLGCGPPPLMDCVRQAVVQHYELAIHGRVNYFEEAYSW